MQKFSCRPQTVSELFVTINDPAALNPQEKTQLLNHCRQANISFYRLNDTAATVSPSTLFRLWQQLGLRNPDRNLCADTDGLSHIQAKPNTRYIPYTNKPLKWHTDGCYNTADQTIRSFAMHCVAAATVGGTNSYFDPDIMYILLRDENPNYINSLCDSAALMIPANIENGRLLRVATSTPALDCGTDLLSLRYSERARNIHWRDDRLLNEALAFIRETLAHDQTYQLTYRLKPGEGVICNNVLHNRDAFEDDPKQPRLLYRARFYDRIGAH